LTDLVNERRVRLGVQTRKQLETFETIGVNDEVEPFCRAPLIQPCVFFWHKTMLAIAFVPAIFPGSRRESRREESF
jgi:hypothetical protein